MSLLKVHDLQVVFYNREQRVRALDTVSFELPAKRKAAVLGESGSGKSVLAMALFGLLPQSAAINGDIIFSGINLLSLSPGQMALLRGKDMVLIPQNPQACLNPVLSIGFQIKEAINRCNQTNKKQSRKRVLELLEMAGLPEPHLLMHCYPHQLSGGMAQRVLLAMGLAGTPRLVVADEPTYGLDADAKDNYVKLVNTLYKESAILLITHDLDIAGICDEIYVVYAGEIVEAGSGRQVLKSPCHPYTAALLSAHPERGMIPIKGLTPGLTQGFIGCRFHPRCSRARDICKQEHPQIRYKDGNMVRCFYAGS